MQSQTRGGSAASTAWSRIPHGRPLSAMNRHASIDDVVAVIASGGVVVIPTDTVYGLACDPANATAVERMYDIKQRPEALELTLLAADVETVEHIVELTPAARAIGARYWPGPVSIIAALRRRDLAIPRHGGTLSCRVPDHPLLLELLRRSGPLASTSANRHGEPPAATAAEAAGALGTDIDAILDGGPAHGLASTIIDCTFVPPRVLREGPVSATDLLRRIEEHEQPPARQTPPDPTTRMHRK